jgi:hypothetical protein
MQRVVLLIIHQDADGLGSVPWGLKDFETHTAEFEGVTVFERREGVIGLGLRSKADSRPDAVPELQVAGEKIRMKMGEENVADVASMLGGILQIVVDVALRINNYRCSAGGVGD